MVCFSIRAQGLGLCIISLLTGATQGIIGPSLPDLALLLGVNLHTLVYMLLLLNGAGIGGNLIIPMLLKRLSMYQLLAAVAMVSSVFYFVVPFSGNIYVVFVVTTLVGTVTFPSFNVVFLKMCLLWPNNPRPYYLAMEASALGAVLSPLILAPFLSDGVATLEMNAKTINTLINRTSDEDSGSSDILINPDQSQNSTHDESSHGVLTLLGICYAIFGALSILTTIKFYCFHYIEQSLQIAVDIRNDYQPLEDDKPKISRSAQEYVLIAVVLIYFLDGLIQDSYGTLLSTYGINRLNMSAAMMSLMTSMFWFAFLLGRLVPCFLSSTFKQFPIIVIGNVGVCAAFVCLIFAMENSTLLWISSFLAGLFYGPRMPASFAWSKKLLEDTPRLVSLKFVAVAIGSIYAYIVDEVMTRVDLDAFVYMHIGMYILNVFMLLCVLLLCKLMKIQVCV